MKRGPSQNLSIYLNHTQSDHDGVCVHTKHKGLGKLTCCTPNERLLQPCSFMFLLFVPLFACAPLCSSHGA